MRQDHKSSVLFENFPEPAVEVAFDGETPVVQGVNGAFEEVFGYDESTLVGESIDEFVVGSDDVEKARTINERAATGDPVEREVYRQTVDGSRWFLFRSAPFTVDGRQHGIGVSFDITERKAYERRVENQRDDLDVLNQMVRHDIRNDLHLVVAHAEFLQDHVGETGQEHLDKLLESAASAVELTETARDLADVLLQSDRDLRPVDLSTVVSRELDRVRGKYSGADIAVDGSIPSVRMRADDMLDSLVRNVLENAIQHNDTGSPEVRLSATVDGDRVAVEVADDGPGVPDDIKTSIFGKGETGVESGGSGAGLYLVSTLVDRYGGDVLVEDNDPRGAVFVVELPACE